MTDEKLARVVGMGSSLLLEPNEPLNPTNRRISIIVMTREAEERFLGSKRTNIQAEVAPDATVSPP
jgi:chemotaxis protein MotB